nr:hypothetical protein [uncultured bacterium]
MIIVRWNIMQIPCQLLKTALTHLNSILFSVLAKNDLTHCAYEIH